MNKTSYHQNEALQRLENQRLHTIPYVLHRTSRGYRFSEHRSYCASANACLRTFPFNAPFNRRHYQCINIYIQTRVSERALSAIWLNFSLFWTIMFQNKIIISRCWIIKEYRFFMSLLCFNGLIEASRIFDVPSTWKLCWLNPLSIVSCQTLLHDMHFIAATTSKIYVQNAVYWKPIQPF